MCDTGSAPGKKVHILTKTLPPPFLKSTPGYGPLCLQDHFERLAHDPTPGPPNYWTTLQKTGLGPVHQARRGREGELIRFLLFGARAENYWSDRPAE